jgi:hypothetical protein
MSIQCPSELISKIKVFEEKYPIYTATEVIVAITYLQWRNRPNFFDVFIQVPEKTLLERIIDDGLEPKKITSRIQRGEASWNGNLFETSEISWMHFLGVLAAYDKGLKHPEKNYLDYIVFPLMNFLNINPKKILGSLQGVLERAYWFTLGGDILQDKLTKFNESPWDYRGDLLGLLVLENHREFNSLQTSELIQIGYDLIEKVDGENFKLHPYFRSADENSESPWFKLICKYGKPLKHIFYDIIVNGKFIPDRSFT